MPVLRWIAISLLGALLGLQVGCKHKKDLRADEDLKAVESADRALLQQEKSLLGRRGALQRERTRIRDQRAALISKKLALDESDTKGRAQLEEEEAKLANLEASVVEQEVGLNRRLQSLLDEKSGLVEKLSRDKGGTVREVVAARREYGVALREKDLARREAELSHRERELAHREQALAERQAKGCPKAASTVQVIQAPRSAGGGEYSRKDVDPVFNAALQAMTAKGILTADLPPGVDRLITEVRHAVAKGDYTRAKYAADQLVATVRTMRIDREFIGAKIGRLGAAIKRSPPSGANREKVNQLFQQATASYGDGRFIEANRELNRIYELLR